jgi:hypothetical protein
MKIETKLKVSLEFHREGENAVRTRFYAGDDASSMYAKLSHILDSKVDRLTDSDAVFQVAKLLQFANQLKRLGQESNSDIYTIDMEDNFVCVRCGVKHAFILDVILHWIAQHWLTHLDEIRCKDRLELDELNFGEEK